MLGLLATALIGLLAGLTVVVTSQTALSRSRPACRTWRPGASAAALAISTRHDLPVPADRLPHAAQHRITTRQVLPGALIATVLLQLTFESLPLYVRSVEGLPALKAFGGAPCCSCGST